MAALRNVCISCVFISGGSLLFGYIIGVNSHIVTTGQLLCKDNWQGDVGSWTSTGYNQCYNMDALEQGVFSSLPLIGATISSLICLRLADMMGRKLEVQIGAALCFVGATVAAATPALWGVYLGFILYGLGIGFTMHAAPMYLAEIASADVRGTLVSAKEAFTVLGIVLGFLAGFAFSNMASSGWRFSVLISGVFALLVEIGIAFVPQSPRFLVLKAVRNGGLLGAQDRPLNEARSALKFFRQATTYEEIEEELQSIFEDALNTVTRRVPRVRDTFQYPRPLLVGCGIMFLQQVTGQPSILYLTTGIFKDAGFGSWVALPAVCLGLVRLIATLLAVLLVDRYGRRKLLLIGITMMSISLLVLGSAFLFQECQVAGVSVRDCKQSDLVLGHPWAIVTAVALALYEAGYQVGLGPIAWLLVSEVFPLNVRGAALSLAATVDFSCNIVMTLTQGVVRDALTPPGLFFTYCGLTVVGFVFVFRFVPETRCKSLEQIEGELTGRSEKSEPSDQITSQNSQSLTSIGSNSLSRSGCSFPVSS